MTAAGALRPSGRGALALVMVLAAAGCSHDDKAASTQTSGPKQVTLSYAVPAGMSEITVPSASASGGMRYDIKLFTGADECTLRVVRLLLPKGDGTEDQDATYNLLGAVLHESGVTGMKTDGLMVPGTPGPVPTLVASGRSSELDIRALGRVSNASLQGYQVVYGCPRGKLVAHTWDQLVGSLHVDGFTGPLTEH